MVKKLISFILALCLLMVSIPAASAGSEITPSRTVEEILDEYHSRVIADLSSENSAAGNSRSIDNSVASLTQETVNTLNDAGYEAYHVTPTNYRTLENQLCTDFEGMGLNLDGSYIIVIHGDDSSANNTTNGIGSRAVVLPPVEDFIGTNAFEYTYNGTTYTMRYVTVTSPTWNYMLENSTYFIEPNTWLEDGTQDILGTFLFSAADSIGRKIPIGTIASLLLDWMQDDNYTALEPGTLTLHATTTWTCDTIQIWNASRSQWYTVQASAYAVSHARCAGYVYNPDINDSVWYNGTEYSVQNTSPKYSNYSQRKQDAVIAYRNGTESYDGTGDIDFFLGDEEGEVVYGDDNDPLFTHYEEWTIG